MKTWLDKKECGRQDSNLHGLFGGDRSHGPAASKAAVSANFTTPTWRVVGAGGTGERTLGGVGSPSSFEFQGALRHPALVLLLSPVFQCCKCLMNLGAGSPYATLCELGIDINLFRIGEPGAS